MMRTSSAAPPCARWAKRRRKARPFAVRATVSSICSNSSSVSDASLSTALPRQTSESPDDGGDLLLQRIGVERLDDVVVDTGFLGGDDVFGLALGGDHDERRGVQLVVGPDLLEKLEAGHRLHVPVGDHQTELALAQLRQCGHTVARFLDIVEADLGHTSAPND